MKKSFSTLGCPDYNMDQIIAAAKENGYDGIELRAVSGTVNLRSLPDFTGSGLSETARKLRDNGLAVSCIGSDIRFSQSGAESKSVNLEKAKAYTEMLNAFECAYLRTFGSPLDPVLGYIESIGRICDGYEALCELAAENGFMPLLETHDDFSTSARVLDIINGVSTGNLGVVWDILHPVRFGEAVDATYKALKDRIRHVHIKDSSEYSAGGFNLVLVGNGKIPVGECVKLLLDDGYSGYFSFEWEKMWHPEIEGPEVAIPHFIKAMNHYE